MFILTRVLRTVVILVFVTAPSFSFAANDKDDFELGKEAFNNKLYQQALDYFELSKGKGQASIPLTYNLAVTHYKLEQYEQSRIYFNEIRDNPKMTSLVEYNLGLIELKLKNKKQAIELFRKVHKNTKKTKLRKLSKIQLSKLDYKKSTKKAKKIKTRASISKGYTDNVTNIANGTASGKADNFSILTASIDGALTNTFKHGLTARVGYFLQDLTQFNQFDFNETALSVKYNFTSGHYKNYISGFVKKSNLDSQPYQTKTGFDTKFRNKIDKLNSISYRYRYENIKEDKNTYSYLSGSRQQFRVDYHLLSGNSGNRFRYQFESNNRNNTATRSYSPQRHSFRYTYSVKFFDSWKSKTDIEYRRSDYSRVATQNRNDDRFRLLTALSYKISGKWNIQGRYEFRDNMSTDATYVYKRNLYYLDLSFRY